MLLTSDMRAVIETCQLCFAATVSPDGRPNLSPKGTIRVWDDEHLFFLDIASPQTRANLEHSHSQLFALPIVPREVRDELEGARTHYAAKERCLFCDIVRQELGEGRRVVADNSDAVALAPYASRSPFETWILPRRHQSRFEDTPAGEVAAVARLLRDVLRRMDAALEYPPYSFVIHSAPVSEPTDFYHWHIEILPKVTRFGAFEWATGFHRNPTLPETAAKVLREAM